MIFRHPFKFKLNSTMACALLNKNFIEQVINQRATYHT